MADGFGPGSRQKELAASDVSAREVAGSTPEPRDEPPGRGLAEARALLLDADRSLTAARRSPEVQPDRSLRTGPSSWSSGGAS